MSITNGFIKSKRFRTLSDLTHKLESLWTAADTVEYTDADLSGVSVANTRPVSILDEEDFNDLTTLEKNNGYIYYVYSTDATTGKTTSYIYTKGVTYGVGDPSVELTWAEYQALPSTKETDGITYYITDRDPSENISIGAENVTYGNTTVDEVLDDILDGGGGHTIENNAGTDMTQRSNLQFAGAYVTDDSTNDRTKVDVVRSMTKAQYDALSAAEKVGIINVTDDNTVLSADMVSYDNTTSGLSASTTEGAIDEVQANVENVASSVDAVEGQIANSSDAYSASKAYAVGDYCIYNDTLYRCVTACSAASWSVNSGCFTADTVVGALGEMSDIENVTVTYPSIYVDTSKIKCYKCGKLVTISFVGAKLTANVGQYTLILQDVPTPAKGAYVCNTLYVVSGGATMTNIYINANETIIRINSSASSGNELYGSITYLTE